MTWPRAAAVAELGWSPRQRIDYGDFRSRLSLATGWYRKLGLRYATTEFEAPESMPDDVRTSQQLETCSDKGVVLNLEDDAPVQGERARFLVDIMNLCWLWRGADLTRGATLDASVGQFPFNFQLGKDRDTIHLHAPATPAGELEVRLDRCDGEVVASLPLAPAINNDGVTRLPAVGIEPRAGPHDLCFTFTGDRLDPMWALDRIALRKTAEHSRRSARWPLSASNWCSWRRSMAGARRSKKFRTRCCRPDAGQWRGDRSHRCDVARALRRRRHRTAGYSTRHHVACRERGRAVDARRHRHGRSSGRGL